MKIKEIRHEIKGVFKQPKRKYYLGKLKHGTPYFNPRGFVSTIVKIRKLKKRSQEDIDNYKSRYPYDKSDKVLYSNIPIVRRAKDRTINLFGNTYFVTWGSPISIIHTHLGWKDKINSPRYEWPPAFMIFFFKWQFTIHYLSPENNSISGNDTYYEMMLWYLRYCEKDIKKSKETWRWVDYKTNESTWDDNFLINK